ncbi:MULTISPECIES: DUF2290 domain-containing protein [unclassified Ectothiorhodospira]|uniref:DUF2290 domain-containing protein n=1 Tax=unclassified Ectothiorhodospira TaxID=2684909 RepID=UPI001EE8BECB|nr:MULTISPECIES: DUF2290 domain-containing protein [unclassified Ectothiorhodospira]MCG5516251.1 DUF2290 domain-containing protein [Ectothiorhodospira sp. 9100]MCG5518076.1 DUF2290 domain-containing protein [Ectothiorhodospira sp. 9905]
MKALNPKSVKEDLDSLISELIGKGICDDANFSAVRSYRDQADVTFSGAEHISIALDNIEYAEIYSELADKRSYNMKLIDGALVQLMYRIKNKALIQHRLSFYPSPNLLPFQNDPNSYMRDDLFLEIVQRRIIPFPLRFDFDARNGVHADGTHPKSHLTLGDVKNCRIPISAPLTPRWFIEFILRNFYQTDHHDFVRDLPHHRIKLPASITANEKSLMHMVVPYQAAR